MAASISIERLNPHNISIGLTTVVAIIFIFALGSTLLFSYQERNRILTYELQTILRGNGSFLLSGDARRFVDRLDLGDDGYFVQITDLKSGADFRSGVEIFRKMHQCVTESYLQFDVKLCRHFVVPWKMLSLMGVVLIFSFSIFLFLIVKANKLVVREFKGLFTIANIPHSKELSFSKAWGTAQRMASSFRMYQQDSLEKERYQTAIEIARQVSHDIRSPLTALNSLLGILRDIPEEHRIMFRSAITRINDVANHVLQRGPSVGKIGEVASEDDIGVVDAMTVELIPAVVDIMASEKRFEFRGSNITIETDFEDSYGAFARINVSELKRVISNLVNNGVEAATGKMGKVTLKVRKYSVKTLISIRDNGRGIPEDVLKRLGQKGVTFGKEVGDSGSGLGIYHAKKTIEGFGGELRVQSVLGIGTEVTLEFPKPTTPQWFLSELRIDVAQLIVVLDDDLSVHAMYQELFKSLDGSVDLILFRRSEHLHKWIEKNPIRSAASIFLMDYELCGQYDNGLDLIEKWHIQDRAILVTSLYEDLSIRDRCIRLNIRQVPKMMVSLLPIRLGKQDVVQNAIAHQIP